MIERHRTLSQANQELRYTTIGELANLLRTNGAQSLVQNFYKYTANIGSNDVEN